MYEIINEYTYTNQDPPRNRKLKDWNIKLYSDNKGSWIAVSGFVSDLTNERPLAEGASYRYTTSSPIISIEGNKLITESNSIYELIGLPANEYILFLKSNNLNYSEEEPVPQILLSLKKDI